MSPALLIHSVPSCRLCPAGLGVDGLYRVSGNLAVIQKLRFAVNHGRTDSSFSFYIGEAAVCVGGPCTFLLVHADLPRNNLLSPSDEKVDLNDSKWEDIHVTTGALKMFFRELPEPLFTYGFFNDLVNAISE